MGTVNQLGARGRLVQKTISGVLGNQGPGWWMVIHTQHTELESRKSARYSCWAWSNLSKFLRNSKDFSLSYSAANPANFSSPPSSAGMQTKLCELLGNTPTCLQLVYWTIIYSSI